MWRGDRVVALFLIAVLTSCARVDPKPDYTRVAQIVGAHTGFGELYDPTADELVAEKVAALLSEPLPVARAVRVALLNNPAFQAGFATLGASRADVVQSALFTNPSFSFGFQFLDGGGPSKLTSSFAQQIADLWQIPIRKKIAQAELERTLLATATQGISLIAETKTRCYRLLALERGETMLQEARALAERAVTLAEAQLAAGEVSRFDVNLARAALLDIDLELLTQERERRDARTELSRTLGLTRVSLPWTLVDDLPCFQTELPDDSDLLATAFLQRLDTRVRMLQVTSAADELTRQYLRFLPDLTLALDFERPDQRTLPGRKILADTLRSSLAAGRLTPPALQSRGEKHIETAQIVNSLLGPSLTVTLPLWDQNQAQIAKAAFLLTQRRKELEELLDAVAAEVSLAASEARSARALVQIYEQQALPQAVENADASLHLYEAGEQSVLFVLDSQESLLRRRRSYIDARRDYAVALAALEQALASPLEFSAIATTQPVVSAEDSTSTPAEK